MPENPYPTAEGRAMKSLPPIVAMIVVLLLLVGGVGAYFGMAEGEMYFPYAIDPRNEPPILVARCYPYRWQQSLFYPASRVESWLRGYDIHLEHGCP